ncbi:hypothetical protein JCM19232_4526 [Vibrio ishigakensis]|uniref:Uncharacterized protein n=1 Tax=Vibrio ishigakensis TaxID=1481914 RepID=A0A0B8PJD3_9VIBR|nr:hypothetical protein JCM19232_4526 [Vibrio ishigakensis]
MNSASIVLSVQKPSGHFTTCESIKGTYAKCSNLFSQMSTEYIDHGDLIYRVDLVDEKENIISRKMLRNVIEGDLFSFA